MAPGVGVDVERVKVLGEAVWSFTAFSSTRRASFCDAEDAATGAGVGMWEIGRASVLARMSENTSSWYAQRDSRCLEAQ